MIPYDKGTKMTIYKVVFYDQIGNPVGEFGYYEDKVDAEARAFDVRIHTSLKSGTVKVEEVHVHERSQPAEGTIENQKFSHRYANKLKGNR